MRDDVFVIDVGRDLSQPRVPLVSRLQDYVEALERGGYRLVRLKGVGKIRTKAPHGEPDEIEVFVDPDVNFILAYYRELEEAMSQSRSRYLNAYLVDGVFELSSLIQPREVCVRAGVGFGSPFAPPFSDTATVPSDEYLAMWRSIAAALAGFGSLSSSQKQ